MIDLCTVVFRQELSVLKLQAQSIARYCSNLGTRNIYVVVNDEESLVNDIDPDWWGELATKVLVVPRTAFSTPWADNGWLSQQLWKLLVPAMSYNVCTMVMDAKTIFVKELKLDDLIDLDKKISAGSLPIQPVFERSRQIVNQTFGINLEKQIGPAGVPYIFHNNTVRSMIAEVSQITKHNFPEWFQAQGMLTEFILYSGYVTYKYGNIESLYKNRPEQIYPVNLCHSETGIADQKLQQMRQAHAVSIHRNAWTALSDQQKQQYRNFLIDHGITEAWNLV